MDPKFNPEAIIQDTASRQPDMPTNVLPKRTMQAPLSTMYSADELAKQAFMTPQKAKAKVLAIYGADKFSPEELDKLVSPLFENNEDAIKAKTALATTPYNLPTQEKLGLLDKMVSPTRKKAMSSIDSLSKEEDYSYYQQNQSAYNDASQRINQLKELNSLYGLSDDEYNEYQSLRPAVASFEQDETFLSGKAKQEQIDHLQQEHDDTDKIIGSWIAKDPGMQQHFADLNEYAKYATEMQNSNALYRGANDIMRNVLVGFDMMASDFLSTVYKAVGREDWAAERKDKVRSAEERSTGTSQGGVDITDQIFQGLGSAIFMATSGNAMTNLLGGGAKAVKIGTYLSGYIPTFYDNYINEVAKGKSEDEAGNIAMARSFITGISELIMPNIDIMKGKTSWANKAINFLKTNDVADILSGSARKEAISFVKKRASEIFSEVAEEMFDLAGQEAINMMAYEDYKIDKKKLLADAQQTALITPFVTALLGFPKSAKSIRDRVRGNNRALSSALMATASSEDGYNKGLDAIEKAKIAKTITPEKADELSRRLGIYYQAINSANLSDAGKSALLNIATNGTHEQLKLVNEALFANFTASSAEMPAIAKMFGDAILQISDKIASEKKTNTLKSVFFGEDVKDSKVEAAKQATTNLALHDEILNNNDVDALKEVQTVEAANTRISNNQQKIQHLDETISMLDQQIADTPDGDLKQSLVLDKQDKVQQKLTLQNEIGHLHDVLPNLEAKAEEAETRQKEKEKNDTQKSQKDTQDKTNPSSKADVAPNSESDNRVTEPAVKEVEDQNNVEVYKNPDNSVFVKPKPIQGETPRAKAERRVAAENALKGQGLNVSGPVNNNSSIVSPSNQNSNGKIEGQGQNVLSSQSPQQTNPEGAAKPSPDFAYEEVKPIEPSSPTEMLDKPESKPETRSQLVSRIIDSNPDANPEKIHSLAAQEHSDAIKKAKNPAMEAKILRDETNYQLKQKNRLMSKKRLFSKKSKPAEKKREPIKDFSNIKKAIEETGQTIPEAPKKELTPGQQPASTEGFAKIISKIDEEIASNPLYYTDPQSHPNDIGRQATEIRHSINSMIIQNLPHLTAMWADANKSALNPNITDEQKQKIAQDLKVGLYVEMQKQVKALYNIDLPVMMEEKPVENFESGSEQAINQAINNYVVRVVNELSKVNTNQGADHFVDIFNNVEKTATEAVYAPGSFMKKSQEILKQISRGIVETDQTDERVEPEEDETESVLASRDAIPNNDNIPEANLISAFYTAVEKILSEKHGINTTFNTEQILYLMFHSFKNPYEMISFAKNVHGLDDISTKIIEETGNLVSEFIDRFMGDNQFDPKMMIYLNNQLRQIFQNRPRIHLQIGISEKGLSSYSINGGNVQARLKAELARGLYEAKKEIKKDSEKNERYEELWQRIIKDPVGNFDSLIEMVNMFVSQEGGENSQIGLLKDIFSIDRIERMSEKLATNEEETKLFNSFIADIFSPIDEDLNDPKFSILNDFLSTYYQNKLTGGLSVPGRKIYDGRPGQSKNSFARPNVISAVLDELNRFGIKVKAGENIIEAMKKLPVNHPLQLLANMPYNQYNPYFTNKEAMTRLTEAEIQSIKNTQNTSGSDSVSEIKNANKEQRYLAGIAAFFNSFKFSNKWFDNLFLPSNKPKIKAYRVGRISESDGLWKMGDEIIIGDDIKAGMFENFINTIIGDLTEPTSEIQAWLPKFFVVTKTGSKNRIELNRDILEKEALRNWKYYINTLVTSTVNFSPKTEFGKGVDMIAPGKMHAKIMRELFSNPNPKDFKKAVKSWIEKLQKPGSREKESLPEGYLSFLKSLESDRVLDEGLSFFEQYLVNKTVNEQFIQNSFVAPISDFIKSGTSPKFLYNRVNSLIAPGMLNNMDRAVTYEVVKFKLPKELEINTGRTDDAGNPIILKFDKSKPLDGVEFISAQYSAETAMAVGPYSGIVGNLKTATSGLNQQGIYALHKNMSIVLTKKLVEQNPQLKPLYDRMAMHGLDKIVTTDGTKSDSEIQKATTAELVNDEIQFSADPEIMSINSNSIVIQQPVNLAQASESGIARKNKLATQLIDQLPIAMNDKTKATEAKTSVSEALRFNQIAANRAVGRFTSLINSLQRIQFLTPGAQNDESNANIGAARRVIINKIIDVVEAYSNSMKERLGKEASQKFTNLVDRLKQNTEDNNPVYSFETDVTGIYEIFNDIVREAQSVWVSGGWHSISSGFVASKEKLQFSGTNGIFQGEVMMNQETANALGYNVGDEILLQKLPFNNMATKFFAKVKIGAVSGSSISMPQEWMDITSSDHDGDAVGSLKIDKNYNLTYHKKLNEIDEKLSSLTESQRLMYLNEGSEYKMQQYLSASAELHAQKVMNMLREAALSDSAVNQMQLRQVTVEDYVNAATDLGYEEKKADPTDPIDNADRKEDIQISQSGIGMIASAISGFYEMAFTNSMLPMGEHLKMKFGGKTFLPGQTKSFGGPGKTVNEDGSSLIDKMSNFLQIMVDSFKHNYTVLFGINNQNLYHALFMAQSQMNEKDILTVLNQPLFKWYSALKANSRNPLSSDKSYDQEVYNLRATLVSLIKKRGMNSKLLSKLGVKSNDEGKEWFSKLSNIDYSIEGDKIKPEYTHGSSTYKVSNQSETIDQLAEFFDTASNEVIEAQVEVWQMLAAMRPMVKSIENWISVRKKFQEGFTNSNEIPLFTAKLEDIGLIAKEGQTGVSETVFEHTTISDTEKIKEIEQEIARNEALIDYFTQYNPALDGQIQEYYAQGFNPVSLKEFLRYKNKMLYAANVDSVWKNTFYLSDPAFRQHVDGFFMGVAQSSSVVPMNTQSSQNVQRKQIAGISKGSRQAINKSYLVQNYSLLESAKNILKNHFFRYTGSFVKMNQFFNDFYSKMDDVLQMFYQNKSSFPNNKFFENLEIVTTGSSLSVGSRKNRPIYTQNFFFKEGTIFPMVDKSEVTNLEDFADPIISSFGINPAEITDDAIEAITVEQAAAAGLNLETAQFLAYLRKVEQENRETPSDFVIYNGNIYDAVTGYPMFGGAQIDNIIGNAGEGNMENASIEDFVDSDSRELQNFQLAVLTLNSIVGRGYSKQNLGMNLAATYLNLIHNYIEMSGGARKYSPMYRKGTDTKVQMSVNRNTENIDFKAVNQSLQNLSEDLYHPFKTVNNGELSEQITLRDLMGDSEVAGIIIDKIMSGEFGDLYGLYFAGITGSYNSWSKIKPILSPRVNQSANIEQNKVIRQGAIDMANMVLNHPKLAPMVKWDDVQNASITDQHLASSDYLHTTDPEGNVILFKKINITGRGVNKFKVDQKAEVTQKQEDISIFMPVGFYSTNHENEYVYVNQNSQSPIQVIANVDMSNFNHHQIMQMISGIVSANQIDNLPESFDIFQFQEQMKNLLGEKETPSLQAIKQKISKDNKFLQAIVPLVGFKNIASVKEKVIKMVDFLTGIEMINHESKLFQNNFYGVESFVDNSKEPVSSEKTKETISHPEIGIKLPKDRLKSKKAGPIGMLNSMPNVAPGHISLRSYMTARNNGKAPETFRDALLAVSKEINADPTFVSIAKLLLNKVGHCKVNILDNAGYAQEELNSGEPIGSTKMIYDPNTDTIIMNGDEMIDFIAHPEALLHEAIHSLTYDIYDTNPQFRNDLNQIVSDFRHEFLAGGKAILQLAGKNPEIYALLRDTVVNETDDSVAAKEFLALAMSSRQATVYKLLNEMQSSAPLPSNMKKSFWSRLIFKIGQAFGFNANSASLFADLTNLMDTYYQDMGPTAAIAMTPTANGYAWDINGQKFSDPKFVVEDYLINQDIDFWKVVDGFYKATVGTPPANSDIMQMHRESNEIEVAKHLMYMQKQNPGVYTGRLTTYLNTASPRTRAFARSFANVISIDYSEIGSMVAGNDFKIAGKVDAMFYTESDNVGEPDELTMDVTHIEKQPEYEAAVNYAVKKQEAGLSNVMSGLIMPPPAAALMKAGALAYIKETQGEKVKTLRIISVDASGAIKVTNVAYDLIRPYITDMLSAQENMVNNQVLRLKGETEILSPNMRAGYKANFVNFEAPDLANSTLDEAITELLKRARANAKLKGVPDPQINALMKKYEIFIKSLTSESYKMLSSQDLAKLVTEAENLREEGLIKDSTFRHIVVEHMRLMENKDLDLIISSMNKNKATSNEMYDLTLIGFEKVAQLFVSPVQWSIHKKEIGDIFQAMNRVSDEMHSEAARDRLRAKELWNAVINDYRGKGIKKWLKNGVRLPGQVEQHYMNRFAELQGDSYVFKTPTDFAAGNPTPAEQAYYDFITAKTAQILSESFSTKQFGGNLFANMPEFYQYFKQDSDGNYNLERIPVPASGMKYRNALKEMFIHPFSKQANAWNEMLASSQMSIMGYKEIRSVNPFNNNRETHSLDEWTQILSTHPNKEALLSRLLQDAKKAENVNSTKAWQTFHKRVLGIRSFNVGQDIYHKEKGPSLDINHNFEQLMFEAHGLRIADRINTYGESIKYLISNTLEQGKNKSDLTKYVDEFIEDHYYKTDKPSTDELQKKGEKTVALMVNISNAIALGYNIPAQLVDMWDLGSMVLDSGNIKKGYKGVITGLKMLITNTSTENDRIFNVLNSLSNADEIKRLFSIDNVFTTEGKYSSPWVKAGDAAVNSMYALYKFNDYLRLMSIVGAEIGHEKLTKIIMDAKNGVPIDAETKKQMSLALDKYLAVLGPLSKATALNRISLYIRQMLQFKRWVMPSFRRKFGLIGATSGEAKTKPIYSIQYARLRMNPLKIGGVNVNPLAIRKINPTVRARWEKALSSYTPEEMNDVNWATMYNVIQIMSAMAYLSVKYWDDDKKETGFFKEMFGSNNAKAIEYGNWDYKLAS